MRPRAALPVALLALALLAGCAVPWSTDPPGGPAERALEAGLRAYDDGQYAEAERHLRVALASGLDHAADRASAHKTLAFVYCTSQRLPRCEREFRNARRADPAFALSRAEAGHPLWGPVYRRVVPGS